MSIALSSLIEVTKEDEGLLRQILSSFSCNKDEDIENFLHSRAVEFESLSKARTYLICDENQLMETNFCLDQIVIYGYISIALKILSVPYDVSNRKRKEIDGLSAKIHGEWNMTPNLPMIPCYGEQIKDFSCYLIGQLSKNSSVQNNDISGAELLQAAYDVIMTAVDAVGGRYVMIECHEKEKLMQFYAVNGFEEISHIADGKCPMVQMIRKIANA